LLICNWGDWGLSFKAIQSIGFQGHISKEDDEDTICIYDPENIEILEIIEQITWKDYSEGY
jgi:hypothetical protein